MAKRFKRKHITTTVIEALKPGEIVMDTDEPSFGVRRQKAKAVFFVRKHANGHRHFLSIGECGTGGLTTTAARKQAGDHVAAIRNGLSPAEQRAKTRAVPTVNAFADTWLEAHVDAKLKPSTAQLYRVILRTVILPALGKLRVDQVTEEHVERMHRAAARTPYNANRAVAVVSSLMKFAERRKLRGAHSNPARGLERYREDKRERFLSREEIVRLGSALANPTITAKHSPFALAAIGLLLLTGMRRDEVLKLRLKEVDQERRLLLLDDSKTGKKAVVLSEHAARLIASLPRVDDEWVFPGARQGRPLAGLRKAWASIIAAANLPGLQIHDLRHTFASVTAAQGASLPMIGRLLGHSQPATTARYAHLAQDPLRDIANRASATIADALGRVDPGAEGQ